MGQLVFQATLGGAVNLIGPNIAGTVNFTLPSADGTSGQALTTNGTGTLAFSSFATLASNTFSGSQTLSAGTANGVTYLNGSKVLTSGSALVFDGSALGIGTSSPAYPIDVVASSGSVGISLRGRSSDNIGTFSFFTNNGVTNDAQIQMRPSDNELRFAALGARSQTFYTNGSERARITSAGDVGIGITAPAGRLAISSGTSDTRLWIQNTTTGTASGDGLGFLMIGTEALMYNYDGIIRFGAGGFETMRLNSDSLLIGTTSTVSGGGILQLASGITFPATQVASSNANTLDDYEEGTWTPAVFNGVVGITISTATYTKIGRMVYFQCDVTIGSNSSASAFVLSGLPFAPSSSRFSGVSIGYNSSATAMLALIGGTNLEFYFTTGASSISNLLASGARFIVGGCYQS